MKRFISVILAMLLAFGALSPAYAADANAAKKLQFNKDKTFRIMQIADIQDGTILTPATKKFLEDSVAYAKPDLIVLSGDNISAGSATLGTKAVDRLLVKTAIDNFMSIFEEAGIPVAVVFGNHDAERNITKEEQMEIYNTYSCCVAVDEGNALYGCGTYNLPIYSSEDADKIAYNIWLTDSNMYDEVNGGYDYVHEDQIDWYVNKSNELKAQNGGKPVPSMMFQHIIVPEIYDALAEVAEGTDGSVERDGKYYALDPDNTRAGVLHEGPCPSNTNKGQFDAVKNQGDVVAMFFGHDHKNSFEIEYEGIDLVNTPGAGFGSYGDEGRGVRIIDIKENTTDYQTSVIEYLDFYADDAAMLEQFVLYGNEFDAGEKIIAFFNTIWYSIASFFSL